MIEFKTIRQSLIQIVALTGLLVASSPSLFAESSKLAAAAGATLFRDKGCAYCHGANAQGTQKGPSLQSLRKTWQPAQIASQIKNGGQKMPSFEDSLTPQEIAELVAYLRARHPIAAKPLPAPPASAPNPVNPEQ